MADLAERVLDLIREAMADQGDVGIYDGKLPAVASRPKRMVLVHVPPGRRESGTVGGQADRRHLPWQVTCISTAKDPQGLPHAAWEARWMAARIRDHLVTRRLAPNGSLIRHTLSARSGEADLTVSSQAAEIYDQYEAHA